MSWINYTHYSIMTRSNPSSESSFSTPLPISLANYCDWAWATKQNGLGIICRQTSPKTFWIAFHQEIWFRLSTRLPNRPIAKQTMHACMHAILGLESWLCSGKPWFLRSVLTSIQQGYRFNGSSTTGLSVV